MTFFRLELLADLAPEYLGIAKKLAMSKIQNYAEITPNIPFTEFNFYNLYRSTFEKSELGRIKKLLPLREMAENFGLTSRSLRPRRGRKSYFTYDLMYAPIIQFKGIMQHLFFTPSIPSTATHNYIVRKILCE